MSRLLAETPLLSAIDGAVVGPKYHHAIYEDQDVRVPGSWTRDTAEVSS